MIRTKIKKINPERSNKMLYAVMAGLGVILIIFFTLAITSSPGKDKKSLDSILAYLQKTEGLIEIKTMAAEKRAVIVFNSDSKNAANFEKVTHYAAVRLSRDWPDCRVLLAKNKAEQIVYEVQVKNGAVANEGPVATENDRP
jgi:hypothetical protein